MRIKQTPVYQFDELDERAKEKARDWYRQGGFDDEWYEATFEDATQCLALAGFIVKKIYFTGFSSQGDGACFEGNWVAVDAKPVKAMKEHAPKDKELHAIAATMRELAKKHKGAIITLKHRDRYCHEYSVNVEVDFNDDTDATIEDEKALTEGCRDAMRWIYRQLEREYDYLNADAQVDESIRANEYEFTAEGEQT